MARARLPLALLALYALAFAWRALGAGVLAFDDHPGQLYRMAHAITLGPWPWRLNDGWWAGYAELQYYPPGFAYAGAILAASTLGGLDVRAAYQVMLWVTFALPGFAAFALLFRVTGSAWLALPGAFLALTLSGGSRSGVEEGVRWGLVSARLGWGLLPLLALSLRSWTERARPPLSAAVLLAAIALAHPAHAPAGAALIALAAAHGPGERRARCGGAALLLVSAAALAAFWLLPLLAHLGMSLPLAWGNRSLSGLAASIAGRPLLALLALLAVPALVAARATPGLPPACTWLTEWPLAVGALIALDALIARPLGADWLPADRLLDGFLLTLVLSGSVGLALVHRRLPAVRVPALALASIALCCALSSPNRAEPTLSLWPRAVADQWPTLGAIADKARLADLWTAIRRAPAGRVLFVQSAVPLERRPEWWRAHSHVTALAPLESGRAIINGTFTHPSPVAGFVYSGAGASLTITRLVEERDGVTLFGRRLVDLGAAEFDAIAERLRISAVVALDEDADRIGFVSRNPAFQAEPRIGPFLVFLSREPRPIPTPSGFQSWDVPASGGGGFIPTGMAFSPLWRAEIGGRRLPVRRDALGLLEVDAPAGDRASIRLVHSPGAAEWIGLGVSVAAALSLAATAFRRRLAR